MELTEAQRAFIAPRIERGIAWLNEEDPDWLRKVSSERLDMRMCTECIIGQVFGNFEVELYNHRMSREQAGRRGFDTPADTTPLAEVGFPDSPTYYAALDSMWLDALAELRKGSYDGIPTL